jgi:hypothetical protein
MASFSNRVTTITQNTILPKVIDTVLNDNFLTYRTVSAGKKWSGVTLDRPVKVSTNTLGGSFSGMDTHSVGTVDTRITASFDPRAYEIPVAIPGLEKAVNNISESQIINLVRVELESSQQDMVDQIGTLLYADGTGNSNKDFLGLDALDDDSTSVVTLGTISRSTYTSWKGVRTSASGTLTLAKLATLVSGVAGGSALTQRPTIFISSEAEFDLYESLISPTVRANYDAQGGMIMTRTSKGPIPQAQLKGGMGYSSLAYRGIPWVADEKAPAGTVWLLNENFLDWYGISDPDLESISFGSSNIDSTYSDNISENTGFQWTKFMRPTNVYGEVAHIYLLGNMVTFNPRRHGRLTSVTGV